MNAAHIIHDHFCFASTKEIVCLHLHRLPGNGSSDEDALSDDSRSSDTGEKPGLSEWASGAHFNQTAQLRELLRQRLLERMMDKEDENSLGGPSDADGIKAATNPGRVTIFPSHPI